MNHDPSVINLKDLRKKADTAKALEDPLHGATVVLRGRSASPEPIVIAQSVAPAPVVPTPVQEAIPVPQKAMPSMVQEPKPASNPSWFKSGAYIASALVAVVGLGFGGHYIYVHIWTVSPFGPTPESVQSQQAAAAAPETPATNLTQAEIIARVSKLMLLPEGEEPVLAAVSDPSALTSETFFKNAKVGDVVIMYGKARRAILYDPSADKVLEVAPITDTPTQ